MLCSEAVIFRSPVACGSSGAWPCIATPQSRKSTSLRVRVARCKEEKHGYTNSGWDGTTEGEAHLAKMPEAQMSGQELSSCQAAGLPFPSHLLLLSSNEFSKTPRLVPEEVPPRYHSSLSGLVSLGLLAQIWLELCLTMLFPNASLWHFTFCEIMPTISLI